MATPDPPERVEARPDPPDPVTDPPVSTAGPAGAGVGSAVGAAPDDDLRALDRLWPAIVAELSKSPAVKALIADCRPIAVDGSAVTLGFPEGKAFLMDVAERRRPTLEAEIARALGHPVAVRMVATNLDLLPAAPESSSDDDTDRIVEAAAGSSPTTWSMPARSADRIDAAPPARIGQT